MYKISLVNMPFANIELPSIALTQIRSVTRSRFAENVSVDIAPINQDFAQYLGIDRYQHISTSMQSLYAGLGDWFFRQQAFPHLPDNTEKYLRRYFWGKGEDQDRTKELIRQKRPSLGACLDELITRYSLDQAQIVGFTSMFMQNAASFAMARRLKEINPQVIIVMGGANCEFPMGQVIAEHVPHIDFVFSGPALRNFPAFVQLCIDGEPSKCLSFGGIFAKGVSRKADSNEILGEELNIDTPIDLDYDDFMRRFAEDFAGTGLNPILPFETSRGCWWGQRAHCTFCGLNPTTMPYRTMKPDLAIRQFNSLFRYSGNVNVLQAVDNILPKSYLEDMLPLLNTPPDMQIFYEVKADLSEKDFAVLAKARVMHIQPGIESLATSTLKLMKKGTTAFQNVNFLKLCTLYGIKPLWNLLIGFPGEGAGVYQRYLEIIPLVVHLEPPSGVFPVRFDRFSPYHSQAESYKLDLHPLDCYSFIYPFDDSILQNLVYYFSDRNPSAEYFTITVQWLGKLQAAVARWHTLWKTPSSPPRLEFKNGSDIICDSRSGSMIEYSISNVGRAILAHLSKPTRLEDLVKAFSDEFGFGLLPQIDSLQEKGLLFQEGERYFSLVLDRVAGSSCEKDFNTTARRTSP